ncbi:MAG: PD40 domain-containing protein [Cyanobacteria bacterium SBC]|nr:PD40 domain-containing protein [Cyanobacteria bacterium SBC]
MIKSIEIYPDTNVADTFRDINTSILPDGLEASIDNALPDLLSGNFREIVPRSNAGGSIERVSLASDGSQGNWYCMTPDISSNGQYVVFESGADNLVAGDENGEADIFLRDRNTGRTISISSVLDTLESSTSYRECHASDPAISGNGRFVAIGCRGYDERIFVRDGFTDETRLVSVASDGTPANEDSWHPAFDESGRYVAFVSEADNLVPGDTNGVEDIFVYDWQERTTTRVSVDSNGVQGNGESGSVFNGPVLSADGRYVAFESEADNFVLGDGNQSKDIFVHDRITGQTTRASSTSAGTQANWTSLAPTISADGRFVAFESYADNLVPGDTTRSYTDIFVHDRITGQTTRVSVAEDGTESNHYSNNANLSGNGRYVVFESYADNLVPGDTNGVLDVFLHDRFTGEISRVSVADNGSQGNGSSPIPIGGNIAISADGRSIAFDSDADNLVVGDTNGYEDVFVRDLGSDPVVVPMPVWVPGTSTTPSDPNVFTRYYIGQPAITPGGQTVVSNFHLYVLSAGNDRLELAATPDPIPAVPNTDSLQQANACWVVGLGGDDEFIGDDNPNVPCSGNQGADRFELGGGADLAIGGRDADELLGHGGDDLLAGNAGTDRLDGGDGADSLFGGRGGDILQGGNGADVLNGDLGQDILTGGGDSDIFVLRSDEVAVSSLLVGANAIVDFNAAEGDRIGLTGGTQFSDLIFEEFELSLDGTTSVATAIQLRNGGAYLGLVRGVTPENLNASMFALI